MKGLARDSSKLIRGSDRSSVVGQDNGTSPEDVMRKMFVRWLSSVLERGGQRLQLRDIRDLLRTEILVAVAGLCCGEPIPNASTTPSHHDHDRNIEAVVLHLASKTEMEWGSR
jgi:hypothetical protein